jgi:hypothetical protein
VPQDLEKETSVTRFTAAASVLTIALATAAPQAFAQTSAPATANKNMQGDQASWIADPHIHAFYALTVQAFAQGPGKVDEAAFTEKSYALFRDFAVARGEAPGAMVEHLKLIPGQVVQIAKEDPEVLKSYDNFVAALFGPQ